MLVALPALAAGGLSTHVLDTTVGKSGAGVRVEVYSLDGGRKLLKRLETDAAGRIREVLTEKEMKPGRYELVFDIGRYFRAMPGAATASRVPFLEEVPVRFGIDRTDEHYHVPILVTPFSYAIYRGS
ncbi:hydroxyisourate hydrolase [bacterium]|nr:hydroxyisourate hydrolase [bacterium]